MTDSLEFHELSALGQVDDAQEFLHGVIDKLCGRKPISSSSGGGDVDDDRTDALSSASDSFFRRMVGSKLSKKAAVEILKKSKVSMDIAKILIMVLDARQDEIERHLREQATFAGSLANLQDFDWSVRLVLSSDKIANIRTPIFILNLRLADANGVPRDVNLQLTREQLNSLVGECDRIHAVVKDLNV